MFGAENNEKEWERGTRLRRRRRVEGNEGFSGGAWKVETAIVVAADGDADGVESAEIVYVSGVHGHITNSSSTFF